MGFSVVRNRSVFFISRAMQPQQLQEVAGKGGVEEEVPQVTLVDEKHAELFSKFECPICKTLPWEPQAAPCGHTLCKSCMASWCVKDPRCPTCRQPASRKDYIPWPEKDATAKSLMAMATIICPLHQKDGCQWKGPWSNAFDHLEKTCDFAKRRCQCGTFVPRREFELHKMGCQTTCEYCHLSLSKDQKQRHYPECKKAMEPCQHGCGAYIVKSEIKIHNSRCSKYLVDCPISGSAIHPSHKLNPCQIVPHLESIVRESKDNVLLTQLAQAHLKLARNDVMEPFLCPGGHMLAPSPGPLFTRDELAPTGWRDRVRINQPILVWWQANLRWYLTRVIAVDPPTRPLQQTAHKQPQTPTQAPVADQIAKPPAATVSAAAALQATASAPALPSTASAPALQSTASAPASDGKKPPEAATASAPATALQSTGVKDGKTPPECSKEGVNDGKKPPEAATASAPAAAAALQSAGVKDAKKADGKDGREEKGARLQLYGGGGRIRVHYMNWPDTWDEWVSSSSDRISWFSPEMVQYSIDNADLITNGEHPSDSIQIQLRTWLRNLDKDMFTGEEQQFGLPLEVFDKWQNGIRCDACQEMLRPVQLDSRTRGAYENVGHFNFACRECGYSLCVRCYIAKFSGTTLARTPASPSFLPEMLGLGRNAREHQQLPLLPINMSSAEQFISAVMGRLGHHP